MLKVEDLVKEQYNFLSHTEFIEKYKFQLQPLKYYRFSRLERPGLVTGALLFSLALVSRFAQNAAFPRLAYNSPVVCTPVNICGAPLLIMTSCKIYIFFAILYTVIQL